LQACLSIAKQHVNRTFNLEGDCPDLFHELQTQRWLATFEAPLPAKLSIEQLEFLANTSHSVSNPGLIRQDGLDQLLSGILTNEINDPQSDWWKTLLKWLDSLKSQEHEPQYQWLLYLLEHLKPSEQTVKYFLYASIGLLLIMTAWLIFNELYWAGFFFKFSGKRQALIQTKDTQSLHPVASQPVISELPPQRQIAALLEQLIDILAERKLIPNDLSLTHRQIILYIKQQNDEPESSFAHLVHEAEPILYGNRPVDSQALGDYRRNAQMLLGRLVI
jgi:hypothetical protein